VVTFGSPIFVFGSALFHGVVSTMRDEGDLSERTISFEADLVDASAMVDQRRSEKSAGVSSHAGATGRSVSERSVRREDTVDWLCRVAIDDVTFGVRRIVVEEHQYRERNDPDERRCRDGGGRDRPGNTCACYPR
jgi:hypothetical protein